MLDGSLFKVSRLKHHATVQGKTRVRWKIVVPTNTRKISFRMLYLSSSPISLNSRSSSAAIVAINKGEMVERVHDVVGVTRHLQDDLSVEKRVDKIS
jgi:hypothetical protein